MKAHAILRVVAKLLIPYILLFAFYVQFHGDYGPGGGFQAGVIFAAAIVLYCTRLRAAGGPTRGAAECGRGAGPAGRADLSPGLAC